MIAGLLIVRDVARADDPAPFASELDRDLEPELLWLSLRIPRSFSTAAAPSASPPPFVTAAATGRDAVLGRSLADFVLAIEELEVEAGSAGTGGIVAEEEDKDDAPRAAGSELVDEENQDFFLLCFSIGGADAGLPLVVDESETFRSTGEGLTRCRRPSGS